MFSILLVLLVIVAILMTGLILLQKSEGSGMSGSAAASMFGGVLTGSAAGNFLTKTTAILATIFFVLCALLSLVVAKTDVAGSHQSALRDELTTEERAAADAEATKKVLSVVSQEKESEPVSVDKK
ncbi:MAG: preprotein translocase subunit SecG [Alphaproteobacteria bacterium]|nr:preprotein translocase subunit SecG [Alphaproteobacteria bacterium]